jgi:hypothetical protein
MVRIWIDRLHTYIGLYFVVFIWLFSVSGLLLNHPRWEFARFWSDREEVTYQASIESGSVGGDLSMARSIMDQMKVIGEIDQVTTFNDGRFKFRAVKPGHIFEAITNATRDSASVKEITTNSWGVLHLLHSFNGVEFGKAEKQRDWILTWVWVIAMDALCLGLAVVVASGIYLWWSMSGKRALGILSLCLGTSGCIVFVFALG